MSVPAQVSKLVAHSQGSKYKGIEISDVCRNTSFNLNCHIAAISITIWQKVQLSIAQNENFKGDEDKERYYYYLQNKRDKIGNGVEISYQSLRAERDYFLLQDSLNKQ